MLRRRRVTLTAAGGGAGTSSASADLRISGGALLRAIRIEVITLAGVATADLTISDEAGTDLVRTNNIAAGLFYPRAAVQAADGTAPAAGENKWTEHVLEGLVNIALAQANVGDQIAVTFFTEE